jgi:hypothetical protein
MVEEISMAQKLTSHSHLALIAAVASRVALFTAFQEHSVQPEIPGLASNLFAARIQLALPCQTKPTTAQTSSTPKPVPWKCAHSTRVSVDRDKPSSSTTLANRIRSVSHLTKAQLAHTR